MSGQRRGESFLAAFLLAIFLLFAGFGAFIVHKINQCSRPGLVPHGCPIVIHVGSEPWSSKSK